MLLKLNHLYKRRVHTFNINRTQLFEQATLTGFKVESDNRLSKFRAIKTANEIQIIACLVKV